MKKMAALLMGAIALSVLGVSSFALAHGEIDQAYDDLSEFNHSGYRGAIPRGGFSYGQSFRPDSATLLGVDLLLNGNPALAAGTTHDLVVEILDLDHSNPAPIVLGVSSGSVAPTGLAGVDDPEWFHFDLEEPVTLTPGGYYGIHIIEPDGSDESDTVFVPIADDFHPTGGLLVFNPSYPFPSDYWGGYTLYFRTYGADDKASQLAGSGIPGKGIGSAPGLNKGFNPDSQAEGHAGKK